MTWSPEKTTLLQCRNLLQQQDNLVSASADLSSAPITQLSYDSRAVQPGALFFCKGAHFKPDYLIQALQAGAVGSMSQTDYSAELNAASVPHPATLLVKDIRPAMADVAAHFYRGLLDSLTLIGFTGTKGKSTTTYMLRAILDSWLAEQGGQKSAWLSTIDNYDGVARTRSPLTTQDVLELYTHFENAVNSNIHYLTMEVSSQALKYHRTRNLHFEAAGFLNIGQDHISPIEHPNHEDYLQSKLRIFEQCSTALVNLEGDESTRILEAAQAANRVLTFGMGAGADVYAHDIDLNEQGLTFTVQAPAWQADFTLPMGGRFNVENALAAISAALALDIPLEHIQKGLRKCRVGGRMELFEGPEGKLIIVDYAHNKMSFEMIFQTVAKEYAGRPIVSIFGATGSKAVERRLELPAVAAQYSSHIYITEDDPGYEELVAINQQIAKVIAAAGKAYTIIDDRDEAIERAINEAPSQSLILVLGKGHETVMRRGGDSVPAPSDSERVRRILGYDTGLE